MTAPGWGIVQVGRLTLVEAHRPVDDVVHATTLVRTIAVEGQESMPPLTLDAVRARQDDLLGLMRAVVPIRHQFKTGLDGWYEVVDTNTKLSDWENEVSRFDWQIRAERIGGEAEVDLEALLPGPQTRTNPHSITGERWYTPPGGALGVHTPGAAPSTMTRTGSEGPLTVYRGIPTGSSARYGCPLATFGVGRARVLDAAGRERTGVTPQLPPTGWLLDNSLVRVDWSSGLRLQLWDPTGSAWRPQVFALNNGATLGTPSAAWLLRNDYDAVTVRLLWSANPGRTTADLTLRRGSRFVEGYLQRSTSGTLAVALASPVGTTSSPGYLTASANDANGHRYILGSASAFTANTAAASITRTTVVGMDFFAGHVLAGSAAVAGDQAAQLAAQYLGAPAVTMRAARR